MKLIEDRFCGLSRAKDFQSFLKNVDVELYQELINHLQLNEGCKSNKNKMIKIRKELRDRGHELELINFMSDRYPHMVVKGSVESSPKPIQKESPKQDIKIKKMVATTTVELYDKMNYHRVFEVYRPKVLFVPQRRIFVGPNKKHVLNSVTSFTATKLDVDYIVLEGPELWHGYVEYFEPRFKDQITSIDHSQRPITLYRKKHNIR